MQRVWQLLGTSWAASDPRARGKGQGARRPSTWAEDRALCLPHLSDPVRRPAGRGSASCYLPGPKGGGCAPRNRAFLSLSLSPAGSPSPQPSQSVEGRKPRGEGYRAGAPDLQERPMKALFWDWKLRLKESVCTTSKELSHVDPQPEAAVPGLLADYHLLKSPVAMVCLPRPLQTVNASPSCPGQFSSLSGTWTISPGGRFGNQMGQYATLLALAQLNGRQAFIHPEMHATLAPVFRISLPVLDPEVDSLTPWQHLVLHDWMSEEYSHLEDPFLKLSGFPCSWTFFHHLREQIRREFTLHDHLREGAQHLLSGLRLGPSGIRPHTFVGVHVRRGDYLEVMPNRWKGVVGDQAYLQQAMDWFRARHKDPIFVVTSNGMKWCLENIDTAHGDVVFAGNGQESTPGKDFALLTQCNHTIMTIGTFGFWAAYLAGGDTVYLANFTLPDSEFLKIFRPEAAFLPEWVGINADLSPLQAQVDPWELDSLLRLV